MAPSTAQNKSPSSPVQGDFNRGGIPYRVILLVLFILAAVVLDRRGVFDWRRMVRIGEVHAHRWWFPPALVFVKIVFYTFAFPGSVFFWVAGLLYHPLEATGLICAGGVGGALCAYFFSRKMSQSSARKIKASRFFGIMEKHGDFVSLCAVRTMPSFPHSIINYGAGMLSLPLPGFALSSLIGFAAKGYVYASAIRLAGTADEIGDALSPGAVVPLLALAALFIAGKLLQRRFSKDPD